MKKEEDKIKQFMKMFQELKKELAEIKKIKKQPEKNIPKMTTTTPKIGKSTKKNNKIGKKEDIDYNNPKDKSKTKIDDHLSEYELEKDDYSGRTLNEIILSGNSKTKKNRKIIYDTTESDKTKLKHSLMLMRIINLSTQQLSWKN